ncbi:periplasmic heavy metal sensor [Tritonibacter horizontis]|uniref:Periplasmic heavy metal sensor n=1 Tax=Tritonibacter horizontis TaxID=1768241 RepID=A0A132BW59_9RHOB|nr:periplasmic heavy metal sensor [Tritonibacter horizontis]KUP92047.1 hypothetical protein TRIHO_30640 [Tritonibacter horizontis]
MTDTSDTKSTSRWPRWLKLVFALSLGANLVVVGVLAGAMLRDDPQAGKRRHKAPPPPAAADAIGGVMYRSFDPAEREKLRRLAEGNYENIVERRVAELNELLEVIRQDRLDVAELRRRITEQSEEIDLFHNTMQEAWIGQLQQMSAPERAAFAVKVDRHISRFRKPSPHDRLRDSSKDGAAKRN